MDPEKTPPRQITRSDLLRVFLRSFLMQSVWNFRSLISVGFSVCLFPVLGKLYPNPDDKRDFIQRHLKFFNSHPYFASYALGVSIRLEEKAAHGEPESAETLLRIKDLLMSPLGAIGDRLFWATIKPACLLFGTLGILLAPSNILKVIVLIFAFILYNLPHLYFRYTGIIEGYEYGVEVYKQVGQQRFETLRKIYLYIFLVSVVVLVLVYAWRIYHIHEGLLVVFGLSFLYSMILKKIINSFYLICFATLLFFLVFGILLF